MKAIGLGAVSPPALGTLGLRTVSAGEARTLVDVHLAAPPGVAGRAAWAEHVSAYSCSKDSPQGWQL